jgi:hypothetical protein
MSIPTAAPKATNHPVAPVCPASPGQTDVLRDIHASDPVERLLEESWDSRSRRTSRRELLVEGTAAALFLAIAVPAAVYALHHSHVDLPLAALLVTLYAIVSRTVKFPIGAGYFVPSYLVLVPMLLLLPPLAVPLLAAAGLMLGTAGRMLARRASAQELPFSIPDAWHAFGPASAPSMISSSGVRVPRGGDDTNHKPRATASS